MIPYKGGSSVGHKDDISMKEAKENHNNTAMGAVTRIREVCAYANLVTEQVPSIPEWKMESHFLQPRCLTHFKTKLFHSQ